MSKCPVLTLPTQIKKCTISYFLQPLQCAAAPDGVSSYSSNGFSLHFQIEAEPQRQGIRLKSIRQNIRARGRAGRGRSLPPTAVSHPGQHRGGGGGHHSQRSPRHAHLTRRSFCLSGCCPTTGVFTSQLFKLLAFSVHFYYLLFLKGVKINIQGLY